MKQALHSDYKNVHTLIEATEYHVNNPHA